MSDGMAVRGTCPHGKVLFLCTTDPVILKQCRKEISDMVSAGFTIDRCTVEEARKSDMFCDICNAPKKRRRGGIEGGEKA